MKRAILSCLILLTVILFIFSCSKNREINVQDNVDQTILDKLDCLGFSSENVQMLDENTILIENDLILEKDMILNPEKHGFHVHSDIEDRQYAAGTGVLSAANYGNITYWIDPAVPANWVTAINEATTDWNAIASCNVNFTQVLNAPNAGDNCVVFTTHSTANPVALSRAPAACFAIPGATFARGMFPIGGLVGSAVIINLASNTTPNADGRRTIMRHEIGHTLGYRHADAVANSEGNVACGGVNVGAPTLICGTPSAESTSIMWSTTTGTVLVPFTNNDLRAARLLYPDGIPQGIITMTSYNRNSGRIWFSCGSANWSRMRVVRTSNGVVKYDGCTSGGTFFEMDTGTSPYTYTVTYFNYAGDVTATHNILAYWF